MANQMDQDVVVLSLQIAVNDNPSVASPTWIDFTPRMRSASLTKSGRADQLSELGEIAAGHMQLAMDNTNRALDLEYAAGPYHGQLDVMRRVRLRGTMNTGAPGDPKTYGIFLGFVEQWPLAWELDDSEITLEVVDSMELFNQTELAAHIDADGNPLDVNGVLMNWPAELTGARVNRLLDAIGFPAGPSWRDVDAGTQEVIAYTPGQGATALAHLNEVSQTELGAFFVDDDGRAVFQDRYTRFNDAASVATFGDDAAATEGEFTVAQPVRDVSAVYNDVGYGFGDKRFSPEDQQACRDQASIDRYWRRSFSNPGNSYTNEFDARSTAQGIVWLYKDALLRVPTLQVQPTGDAGLLRKGLSYGIGTRITLNMRPKNIEANDAAVVSNEHIIEQTSWEIVPDEAWTFTWALSRAFPPEKVRWLILDDPVRGLLDSDNLIGF